MTLWDTWKRLQEDAREYTESIGKLAVCLGWSFEETTARFTHYVKGHSGYTWRECYEHVLAYARRTGKWPEESNGEAK